MAKTSPPDKKKPPAAAPSRGMSALLERQKAARNEPELPSFDPTDPPGVYDDREPRRRRDEP